MVSLSNNNSNNIQITTNNDGGVNLRGQNTNSVDASNNGNSQRAKSWAVGEGLIDGVDYSAKHYAQLARETEQEVAADTESAHIWAEGTDAQVQELGGTHSSKGWVDYVLTNPPKASIEQTETGATITITDIDGTTTADITNGADGVDGVDGYSPTATVTSTSAGATITITDANGTTTANITNGTDGVDGTNGVGIASIEKTSTSGLIDTYTITYTDTNTDTFTVTNGQNGTNGTNGTDGTDGFSPIANVTQTSSGATISITDENGTTTANITNGTDGTNGTNGTDGQDGFSPIATVSKSGTTATITITDINGTTTATVSDGAGGVSDVQVNGSSVLVSGVANIDLSGYATLTTAQTISGRKTFTGEKAIYFKQSSANDKLGFTLYNSSNTELGAFEYRPNTISGNALIAINTSYANSAYVGFRYWGTAINVIAPKPTTAGDYYIPLSITDGNSTVKASSTGSTNISTLLPTVPTNISSFTNDSGYITGITSGDVTTALGYTPYSDANPDGFISGITSGDVTSALGYTPANTTLSNLSTTSSTNFDGQVGFISATSWNIASAVAMNGGSTPLEEDISSMLPNDNADYMCLFTGRSEPYNYPSRTSILAIKNSLDADYTYVCGSVAYDANAKPPGFGSVWLYIPASNRKVYIYRNNSSTNYSGALVYLGMREYRRVGTNT